MTQDDTVLKFEALDWQHTELVGTIFVLRISKLHQTRPPPGDSKLELGEGGSTEKEEGGGHCRLPGHCRS